MASYLPKKKYLSSLVQDAPECLSGYGSLASSRVDDVSGISCSASNPLITANSRIPSFLLMSDSQRNFSDSDLKLLGSPLVLGGLGSERFGSGLSLDSLEKFCNEQEAYNSENSDGAAMLSSTHQRPAFLPVTSSCSLLSPDFSSEDLMLLSTGSLMQKTGGGGTETCPIDPPLAGHGSVEIAQDALLPSLPSLSSFSSLSEVELNAHPSTGSFSSILNGLDAGERVPTPVGSLMRNLLTGSEDQQALLSDTLLPFDNGFAKTLSSQSLFSLQQSVLFNSTFRPKPGALLGGEQKEGQEIVPDDRRSPSSARDVYIKEEAEEDSAEAKQVQVTTSGRNRGSGKSQEPKFECQVCGDVAAGYHCGAYVCEACKKFYLRCLKTRGAPAFLCPKNNDCDITKDTRSHCQYCRFQKCITLGMYKPGHEDDKKLKINFKVIPCKVCSAPSSGFHFGAITCEGCKGFFRRMLKEQLHKKFVCVNDEPCNIDSANRTTCKCCRFEKCLQVGMTLEGTRLGRQSNSVKRRTLMQYVSPEQLSAQRDGHYDEACNDDLSRSEANVADPEEGDGEDENSCSAPLCINFPSIKVSRERLSSQSSATSPPAEVAMPTEADGGRRATGKTDVKFERRDAGNGGSLPVAWKSNSYGTEAYQSKATLPSNERNLEESKAKITNFVSRCSALVDASKSLVYADNKETTNFGSDGSQNPYQSYEAMRRKGGFAGQALPTWTWNGSTPEVPPQQGSNLCRSTEVDPRCTNLAEAPDRNARSLKRSFASSNLYPEGPSCSAQNNIQPREVDVNRRTLGQHPVPATDAAFSNPERPPTADLSPAFGVVSPSVSSSSENASSHPLSAEGDARLYRSPQALFGHLVTAFQELEEISRRPPELDELQFCPVSIQTIWKLVEIPFIHQSKIILRFIKKVPGFRQLAVEDQIQIAQESLYPVVLLYHSRSYDLETGEFDWFMSTAKERDIILNVLTPFRTMQNHFRCIGHIVKRLNMTKEELAFVAAMSVLTASEGSPMQSGNRVCELQDELLEAFVSYQQEASGGSPSQRRIGELLARLPELKRANIEHRLIVAQVQQLIPEIEMSNLYQEIFLSGRPAVQH